MHLRAQGGMSSAVTVYQDHTETEQEHKDRADAFFNDDPQTVDAPAQDMMRAMQAFVMDYSKKLGDIREVLSDTISEAWYVL